MSDSIKKYQEMIFWDEQQPIQRINNTLTNLQACNIINKAILHCKDSNELLEELETLKDWIKSK